MNIEHMIEQMPEFKITKKIEYRTVHFKDDELLKTFKEGHKIECVFYVDKEGKHWKEADIVYYYNFNMKMDKYYAVSNDLMLVEEMVG